MPVLKSSKKALKRDIRNKKLNDRQRQLMREAIKIFRAKPTPKTLRKVYSVIDTARKKGVIHKNKASRLKSRLHRLLKKTGNR